MAKLINPNFKYLVKSFTNQEYDGDELIKGKRGCMLSGSSRSGKTIASIDFIILLCSRYESNCVINIVKETYNSFKTTLYNDFSSRLRAFGIHDPFQDAKELSTFKIFGNKINFLGADKPSKFHGAQCDYLWINEPLEISQDIFDQAEMRCKNFWWMDMNPSVTEHWIFNSITTRADVGYIRTTFKDNPFVSTQERNKLLGFEPYESGSYTVENEKIIYRGIEVSEKNQPPPHIENIESGTADEFMWKVYGLGLKGAMKGLIFKNVTYIDKFPDLAHTYGLDFGFTADPTALVKYAEDANNIYMELLIYQPMDESSILDETLKAVGVSKYVPITADSSDKYVSEKKGVVQMVRELFERGWEIQKVSKTKGIMYWILSMKSKKIHIVKSNLYGKFKKEQENYRFKTVNGILINQPIDGHDHAFSSGRYAHMSHAINESLDI